MLKRISFALILVLMTLGITSTVYADDPLRISSMDIFVFPEYDQPGVLVQYQGKIAAAADKSNPREVAFLVPKGVGISAACAIKTNGDHTSETWKESDAGDGFTQVTFKINEPQFHVEYYYNPLVGAPETKMDFGYKAFSPADEITFEIQHPLKATNFGLTPDSPDSHKADDGFTYHSYSFKQVSAGAKLVTSIAYTKTDPNPSVSGQKQTASSANKSADSNSNLNQAILVGIFLGAIVIAGVFFLQKNARRAEPCRASVQARGESSGGFCTQCGNGLDAEDKFCPRCGSPRGS